MQSTISASTIARRMSPSPDWLELIDPLASTKPARPLGERWWMKCCTQAKLALPFGRRAVLPAHVFSQLVAAPVAIVERRIGQHEIGLQVLVQVAAEAVGVFGPEVAVDAANGKVHHRQPPRGRVRLLAVDGNVADPPAVLLDELLALHEHAAGAAARVEHAALVRGEHFDQHADDATGRVELAALLAFGTGELREEVFVDAAQDVLGAVLGDRPGRWCRSGRSVRRAAACRATGRA